MKAQRSQRLFYFKKELDLVQIYWISDALTILQSVEHDGRATHKTIQGEQNIHLLFIYSTGYQYCSPSNPAIKETDTPVVAGGRTYMLEVRKTCSTCETKKSTRCIAYVLNVKLQYLLNAQTSYDFEVLLVLLKFRV